MPMKPVLDEFVSSGDLRFHYVQWGEHGTPIVCITGITANAFCFQAFADDLAEGLHSLIVHSQDDIRAWYASRGPYFYIEDADHALLFAPEMDRYVHIIRDVLWHGVSLHSHQTEWRSQQQRYEEGGPQIRATKEKWRLFQQQGAAYANETGAG